MEPQPTPQKSTVLPIFLTLLISAIVFGGLKYYLVSNKNPTDTIVSDSTSNTIQVSATMSNKELETAVYTAVDKSTNSTWDKRIEIAKLDATQKAAKGHWYAHDQWDWIAWQENAEKWNVLVSMDGFKCKELDTVPAKYNVFFQDIIYKFDTSKRYCL